MKNPALILFLFSAVIAGFPLKDALNDHFIVKKDSIKLKITIGEKTASAVLNDQPAGRDFAAQLPLTFENGRLQQN